MKRSQKWFRCIYPCIFLVATSTFFSSHFSMKSRGPTGHSTIIAPQEERFAKGKGKLLMEWQRAYHRNGLGNQLFLYASLLGLAKRHGFQAVMPSYSPVLSLFKPSVTAVTSDEYDRLIANGTDIPKDNIHSSFCCSYFAYTENLHYFSDRDVVLRGAFQSWRYFHPDAIREIRNDFRFHNVVMGEAAAILQALTGGTPKSDHEIIGLHIRRGDILKAHLRKFGHVPAPKSYFTAAIDYMEKRHSNCIFIVVSNDLPWAKSALANYRPHVIFAPANVSPETSMALLTMMDHLILSVGTFSWWSGYLSNASDIVYFKGSPEPLSFYDVTFRPDDYYLPHWVGLSAN